SVLTFPHLITLAGAARVVLMLIDGSLTRKHLRVTAPQLALLVLLAVSGLVGIAFAATSGPLGEAPGRLADVADHLVFLTVALALTRKTGPTTAVNSLAVGLLAGLVIAVLEHVTGRSF